MFSTPIAILIALVAIFCFGFISKYSAPVRGPSDDFRQIF